MINRIIHAVLHTNVFLLELSREMPLHEGRLSHASITHQYQFELWYRAVSLRIDCYRPIRTVKRPC